MLLRPKSQAYRKNTMPHGLYHHLEKVSQDMTMVHRGRNDINHYGKAPKLSHCNKNNGECTDKCRCKDGDNCNDVPTFNDCKNVTTEATKVIIYLGCIMSAIYLWAEFQWRFGILWDYRCHLWRISLCKFCSSPF